MPHLNAAGHIFLGTQPATGVFLGSVRVWPPGVGSQPKVTNTSSAGTATITWSETVSAEAYQVRRNGALLATQSARVFTDTGLEWDTEYSYTITPVVFGILGEESLQSEKFKLPKGQAGAVSATNMYHDRVTVSWPAVPGATKYILVINGSPQVEQTTTSRVVYTASNSTFTIAIRPVRNSVNGIDSPAYSYYSGRPQSFDVGSRQFWLRAVASGSWRTAPSNSWGQAGDHIRQGVFAGSSFGYYRGLIDFGHFGAQNTALAACNGVVSRITNGWASQSLVTLYKNYGVGTNGGIILRWAATGIPAGGDPLGYTDGQWFDSHTNGSGSWGSYDIGHANANALIKNGLRGICCVYDSNDSSRYGDFSGISAGGDSCDLLVTWSWNYVSANYKSPVWALV